MKDNTQLVLYAVGGTFVLLIVYSLRDYLIIGQIGRAHV